ncbi:glycosyltransferase [bacterium]|nr:glycosyltransferase [bacterium]
MNNLTVAICAYNCEQYIEETLTCILNQTYQNFDLLIVNDCSTDNSRQLIESYLKVHKRAYTLVNFNVNKGLSAGRHHVENLVQTKYILFVDADDCPYPTLVQKLYNKISNDNDIMAVGCYHEFIDYKSKKIGGGIFLGETTKEGFYLKAKNKKLIFMQPTAIINREALLKVGGRNVQGFFEGKPRYQDLCEDLDLWTRMSDLYTEGKAILVVPEILCRYRKHEQALSANSLGMVLRMRHIKKNLLLRRDGAKEKTFIDFYNALTEKEMAQLKQKSKAADCLRNGAFLLKKGKVFSAFKNIIQSIVAEPGYLWQKIKSNSGLFK